MDGWTTRAFKYAFNELACTRIDKDWQFKMTHLAMKVFLTRHRSSELAAPIADYLIEQKLHDMVLGATTDAASSNGTCMTALVSRFAATYQQSRSLLLIAHGVGTLSRLACKPLTSTSSHSKLAVLFLLSLPMTVRARPDVLSFPSTRELPPWLDPRQLLA